MRNKIFLILFLFSGSVAAQEFGTGKIDTTNFVNITDVQTITGQKTFTKAIKADTLQTPTASNPLWLISNTGFTKMLINGTTGKTSFWNGGTQVDFSGTGLDFGADGSNGKPFIYDGAVNDLTLVGYSFHNDQNTGLVYNGADSFSFVSSGNRYATVGKMTGFAVNNKTVTLDLSGGTSVTGTGQDGVITCTNGNIGSLSATTITITNTYCQSASTIQVTLEDANGASDLIFARLHSVSQGSFQVDVINLGVGLFTGNFKIHFHTNNQ